MRWKAIASCKSDAMTVAVTDASFQLLTRSANKGRSEILWLTFCYSSSVYLNVTHLLGFLITSLLFILCCTLPISLHQDMTGEQGTGNGMPQRGQVWRWRLNANHAGFYRNTANLISLVADAFLLLGNPQLVPQISWLKSRWICEANGLWF